MAVTDIHDNMIYRLSSRRSPKEVKLLHLEWAVVTQLDGEKNVGEIADVLALSHEETQDIFRNLINEGLLELVSVTGEEKFLPRAIMDDVNYELTVVMGPVASILVEDTLQLMRKRPDQMENTDLPVLIDLLSNQIHDTGKQLQFQKNTYEKTKSHLLNV